MDDKSSQCRSLIREYCGLTSRYYVCVLVREGYGVDRVASNRELLKLNSEMHRKRDAIHRVLLINSIITISGR